MELRSLALVLIAACSGNKTNVVEDATHAAPKPAPSDAAPAPPPSGNGDVQVRVEWKDTPQAVRAPGPVTHCGSPRAPAVTPTTLWGVPDVIVSVEGGSPTDRDARIVLEDCDFTPRAVVAGASVTLVSAMREPARVTLAAASKPARTIYMPIAGHAVDVALDPDTIYTVAYGTDDVAVVATGGFVGATDASGNVVLRGLPAGPHTVRAVLPARNGADARTATAQVNVTPGALAEVTVDIGRP